MHAAKVEKVAKYVFFGAVTAGIEFGVFVALLSIVHIYVASTISFFAGLLASFLFNKFIVFRNSQNIKKSEVGLFLVLGVANSQLSSLLTLGASFVMPSLLAKIASMVMIALWNYLLMNFFIFRKHEDG